MKPIHQLFVTATGTEIGKTAVSCAIARYWTRKGSVGVMKPIASGGREDAFALKKAARSNAAIETVNPVLFKHPLAPYSAALLEKNGIDWKKIRSSFHQLKNENERLLVEGIGGIAVPLDQQKDVADLIKMFRLPAIVVAHSALGTLNHTLLTLEYLNKRKIKVLGIVLNFFDRSRTTDRTNLNFFRRKGITVLATFSQDARFRNDFDFAARQIEKNPFLKRLLA